jgi:hypothetical protein
MLTFLIIKEKCHLYYGTNIINNKSYSYPNITAFHIIILLSVGAPDTPVGGSSCNLYENNRLKLAV